MRGSIIIALSLLLVGTYAACAPKSGTQTSAGGGGSFETQNIGNTLPPIAQLMVGTFRLEGTDQAVKAEQAKQLLVLWKGYRSLTNSDSASPQESDALAKQIENGMTDEQRQAIADMHLASQDLMAVMQEQGIDMQFGGARGNMSPEQIQTRQAERAANGGGGGGGPQGGFPGGGPGGGFPGGDQGGQAPSADQIATMQAQRGSGGGGGFNRMMLPGPLFDALIKLLEGKV